MAFVAACGPSDESSITGIGEVESEDTTPPSIASLSPLDGQTGVRVDATIEVRFSEAVGSGSIGPSSLTLSGGMSGTVSASGQSAVLDPAGDLEYSTTYTATVRGTVTDAAGNALGSDRSWSFTTEAAPAPPFSMAFSAGKLWHYSVAWNRTVVSSSTGVRTTQFRGQAVLVADRDTQWMGRSAWRLLRHDIEDVPGDRPFSREVIYVSEDSEGLSSWVANASGGTWRRILSTTSASFSNNHFLMAGDPRGPTTAMSVSQVSGQAGSFATLRALVDHRVTGQYVPEDIFETRMEHYADGVGLVRASWDFDFDDNDPAASDVFEEGAIELIAVSAQSPSIAWDSEPNDGPGASAQALTRAGIAEGDVAVSDPGTLINHPSVHANASGQPLLQDWYRFTLSSGAAVRMDLTYEKYTNGAWNDVDLYLFAEGAGGAPAFLASSNSAEGEDERISGQLPAGTYYLAVQAWRTPTGPVEYSLLLR
jgi:hypothetical protein